MAAGLQCWDENGNLLLDTTSRVGRLIAKINTGGANGSYTVSAEPYGTLQCVPATNVAFPPNITVSGLTVSWSFTSSYQTRNINLFIFAF